MTFHRIDEINKELIASEWDKISDLRHSQLNSEQDISFNYILKPYLLNNITDLDKKFNKILEIGCGTGVLAQELVAFCNEIIGIDLSKKSIEIANQSKTSNNIKFIESSIEEYAETNNKFDLIVANMVLMDVENLDDILSSIGSMLLDDGNFIFTIIHPCFWGQYKGYQHEEWFNYIEEFAVNGEFTITLDRNGIYKTTHIHRPLEKYINSLIFNGFKIDEFKELILDEQVKNFKYPRFLGIRVSKVTC